MKNDAVSLEKMETGSETDTLVRKELLKLSAVVFLRNEAQSLKKEMLYGFDQGALKVLTMLARKVLKRRVV